MIVALLTVMMMMFGCCLVTPCRAVLVESDVEREDLENVFQVAQQYPMLNDHVRNKAFRDALEAAVLSDSHVLDIGAGSGLLSMMASSAGAASVHSIERNRVTAKAAEAILELNGFGDNVTMFRGQSNDIAVGTCKACMPRRANLLISEVLGCEILAEHWLPTLEDAKERLLTDDAIVIPAEATVFMQPLWTEYALPADNQVAGFDVSPLRRHRSIDFHYVELSHWRYEEMTPEIRAFEYDFRQGAEAIPYGGSDTFVRASRTGVITHVILYWSARLHSNVWVHTRYFALDVPSHWQQMLRAVPDVYVQQGELLRATFVHDRHKNFGHIQPAASKQCRLLIDNDASQPLHPYWVDTELREHPIRTIEAKTLQEEMTHEGTLWIIKTPENEVLLRFHAQAGMMLVHGEDPKRALIIKAPRVDPPSDSQDGSDTKDEL